MNFPANHLVDIYGLKLGFLFGSGLFMCGLGFFSFINVNYIFAILGSIFVSMGQPFIINCPAKVSTFWFKS